jgi:hypothetical protein
VGLCHNNNISINGYLIAKMMQDELINRVVIAADIRKYRFVHKEGLIIDDLRAERKTD